MSRSVAAVLCRSFPMPPELIKSSRRRRSLRRHQFQDNRCFTSIARLVTASRQYREEATDRAASTQPVARPSRSVATMPPDNSMGGSPLHVGAHGYHLQKRRLPRQRLSPWTVVHTLGRNTMLYALILTERQSKASRGGGSVGNGAYASRADRRAFGISTALLRAA